MNNKQLKRWEKLVLLVFLLLALDQHKATAQYYFTLDQSIDYALQHSLALSNNQLDVAQSEWKIKEIKSAGLPQLNTKLEYQYFFNLPTQLLPNFISPAVYGVLFQEGIVPPKEVRLGSPLPVQFGTKNNTTASATLSQLVFSGSYLVGLQASKVLKSLTQKQLHRTEKELRKEITKAYYTALVVSENKALIERNLQLLDKALFEASQYYKNGFIEQLDIDKLQLSMSTLMTQIENLNRQVQLTNSVLKFQMSMPLTDSLILVDSLSSYLNAALPTNRSEQRIEFQLLAMQKELNLLNMKRYKMNRLPTVAAFASASANRQSNAFDMFNPRNGWFPTTLFGLNISLNIFDSGLAKAQIQQASIDNKKIANGIEITRQAVALEIAKSKIDYQNAVNSLNGETRNMALAEKIYTKTRIKYKEGVGSSTEVTQAEGAMFQSQSAYINAIYQLLLAKTDLNAAFGGFESDNQ